ncbi:hypothetical protein D210916BOD24_21110 [Alteromonas sp. D210916BOD_24]|uniref:GGDEF domain-containing protein n=1 Tax=Alteromonas sp. D210916BOD_24 TaxID=3157618 RepID=UPI00399D15F4
MSTKLRVFGIIWLTLASSLALQASEAPTPVVGVQKINTYSHITATAIFHWNAPSEISNNQIKAMLAASGFQEDDSRIGVIFRHLVATATANDTAEERLPIYVKHPLLPSDWAELKKRNLSLYAAAKAYYLFARGSNEFEGSHDRLVVTVPDLHALKTELLASGDHQATAIASIWLAMELTVGSPILAIDEIEYALPFLPKRSNIRTMENYLSDIIAHDWLRKAYLELSVPSKAYEHAMKMLALQEDVDITTTWAYFTAVDALLYQSKFEEALALSETAVEVVSTRHSAHEMYLTLMQRIRIYALQRPLHYRQAVEDIYQQIQALTLPEDERRTREMTSYTQALYHAVNNNETAFEHAVAQYIDAVEVKLVESGFKKDILLRRERELSRLYDIIGDQHQAFLHYKQYEQIRIEKNAEQFALAKQITSHRIAKDIALSQYRQKELVELRDAKRGLSNDKDNLKSTILALISLIFALVAIWLWLAKRQSDSLAEFDSLTGALTRRAMMKRLKNALKKDRASCVAMIDIDHFKNINDRFGHLVGDEVLVTFSEIIRNRIRKSDKLCRYGGEEFLVYFTDSTEREVKIILDELNHTLASQRLWRHTDERFTVSFSSGVLKVNGGSNLDSIISACDTLLYNAKKKGRSRVETGSLSPC